MKIAICYKEKGKREKGKKEEKAKKGVNSLLQKKCLEMLNNKKDVRSLRKDVEG